MSTDQSVPSSPRSLLECCTAQNLWYWAPVVAYAGLIFYGSSLSSPPDLVKSVLEEASDKVLHFCEYSLLGALAYRACRYAAGPGVARSALSFAITGCVLYGLSDELHQFFVPFREADVLDLMADAAGASAGAWSWMKLGR